MTLVWSSLYFSAIRPKILKTQLDDLHKDAGYVAYNPFPGGDGTPSGATRFVRLFVALPEDNWGRLIGEPDPALLPALSEAINTPILHLWASDEDAGLTAYGGQITDFLAKNKALAALENALTAPLPPAQQTTSVQPIGDLAAQFGADATAADKLVQKTMGKFFKGMNKATGGEAAAMQAKALEVVNRSFNWGQPVGLKLRGLVEYLNLPGNWAEPSFSTLATAYPIACLLDQDENALLLPGDEDLLDAVEYPLDYTPVYYAQ